MRFQKSYLWFFLLAMFLAGLVGVGLVASTSVPPAAAQDARVMISPATSTLSVDDVVTVEVYIENVQSLWAGQVALSFDPAVVQVVDQAGNPATQIQRGDLLNPARVTEYVNVVNNAAGIIEYAATLRNDPRRPVPPASGSGSFARVFFKGIAAGTSQVAFSTEGATYIHEIKFVDGDLNEFTLPLEDGSITVSGAAANLYLPLIVKGTAAQLAAAAPPEAPAVSTDETATLDAAGKPTHQGYGPTGLLDVPEKLATAHPFDVAVGGGYAFWTELPEEFCAREGAVKAVNLTSLAVRTLRSSCDISPASVVADDAHVYYIDWASDTIQRIPVGGGASTTVASATGLIFHRAMALDSTHVYFGDNEGIKRVPKAGGAVETLAAGYDSAKLAVDDTHVYWTERSPGGGGAIRRVPKAGGTVDTIVSGSSLDDPWGIAVDATHVYWTELGSGKARRVPKTGGTISDFVGADPLYMGQDIAVDGTNVYWQDTTAAHDGRLRRAPKGGGTVENLALGLFGPTGLNLTATHVYWGDYDGVWRLPIGAAEVRVDLTIANMEITQGIQNLANDVPLVEGKTTYVRVYPRVTVADTPNVTARLRGFRGGVELPGSPLSPIAPTVYVRTSGVNRATLNDTFNFWIPPAWRSGTVEFRAEINPGGAIPESNTGNNTFSITRTFNHKNPLCVDMVRVRTNPTTASIDDPGFWDIVNWLKAAHPVPDVWIYRGGTIEEVEVCGSFPFYYPCGGPYEMPGDSEWVLAKLWWYNLWTNDPSECDDQAYYFGMVHQSHLYQGGAGYLPGDEAWGAMNTDPAYLGGTWPWYVPHGGSTLAHELGHNLGRRHVNCGGPAGTDPGYPYNNCDIGPNNPNAYFGFDVLDVAVIPPTTAGDLMSYAMSVGKPRWPSDYTYRALYNALPGTAASASSAVTALAEEVAQAPEVLAVTGVITPTEGTAALDSAYRLPQGLVSAGKLTRLASRVLASPTAAYNLRLLDAAGNVLREQSFDLPDNGDPVGDMRSFNLLMPYDPQTAFVVLFQDDTELVRRAVSPSPPSVRVLTPNGGENIAGSMTVKWEAGDPDDDTLLYTVQYSPDAGDTWQTLATNYYTRTLVIDDLRIIPGSNAALVRVIATDSVNTGFDTSDKTFSVAFNPPDAHISRPDDGAVFAPGTQIILMGGAIDAEDGTLPGEALQWFVDGDSLGFGREIALSGLEPGTYVVTLRATDSGQMTGEDQITIHVQELLCEAADQVDLVFLLDTAPDMDQYLDTACGLIPDVVSALETQGLEVRHQVFGISQKRACANASVRDEFPTSSVDHPADWGPAVMDVAGHYEWLEGYTRLIVPISNQGPEDGNLVEDPGADRDAINAAIAAAQLNHVAVAPLLMPPADQEELPAILELAEDLAEATGGQVFQWGDPDLDLSGDLWRIVGTVACAPVIAGVSPVCGVDEETTLTLFGENLAVGTRLFVGGALAREVTPNEDGTRMTFKIPLGLETGRTYDLRVDLPGVGSDTLPGGLTVGPCPDRCDNFMPGDIHPPMWDLWDGEMTFQALAAGSRLTVRLYANGGGMELSVEDIGGTPLGSTPVADGATGAMTVPTTPGNIYVIRVKARQPGLVHFRLLSWGANWLRIPDDGDNWPGGVNPGPGENHGAESNPELGFDERWTEVGPQFATTVWYFNVLPGTNRLAVRVWGESPFGDGHAGMEWIDPSGVVIPLVGPEGPNFDHTWTVTNPTPGFWGLRIKADPPFSPWAQHYSLARVDESDDDWLYFRTGSLAGPPCGPSVTLDPPEGPVCLSDVFRMDIVVSDVTNLYGAEVHLTFDPAMLEVVDAAGNPAFEIVPGPFLDPAQGILGLNSADNVGGFIDYAVSLKDPAPPAFGTGVLATVYFRPKATGTTTVQFGQVKLSEKPVPPAPGAPIPAVFRDATFEVNECFAPGQETGAMSGQVLLDGRLNHSGAEVGAEPGGHLVLTLPDGSFDLAGLPAGDYTVDVRKTSYLRAGERTFTVAGGATLTLPNVTLLGGDCNNDDIIDITDGAIASASFNFSTGQPGFDPRADINGDGLVDIFDLVMVGNNFGCSVTDPTARCQRWNRP